jgi:hypothetical protein
MIPLKLPGSRTDPLDRHKSDYLAGPATAGPVSPAPVLAKLWRCASAIRFKRCARSLRHSRVPVPSREVEDHAAVRDGGRKDVDRAGLQSAQDRYHFAGLGRDGNGVADPAKVLAAQPDDAAAEFLVARLARAGETRCCAPA